IDKTPIVLGIDDGAKYTGIALVQDCATKNKPVFKGTIEHRQDVKDKMDVRRGHRRYRRSHKKYRKERFDNRRASKRKGRIPPSIKQKKESTLRVIKKLNQWCRMDHIYLEDVQIDIRAFSEGKKLYRWQYQKSNRLDENLRIATLKRDQYTCQSCGKTDCMLEVHHITPKRLNGSHSIKNLITLCSSCHDNINGEERKHAERFYAIIGGKKIDFRVAMHVMQGKSFLRKGLNQVAPLTLTTGGETANKRIDWNIEKSHSNDAIVITNIEVTQLKCEIKDWVIKPMRRKSKAKTEEVAGFKHRDYVCYTKRNGEKYFGYITALYPKRKQFNMTTIDGKILKRYGIKPLKLIWRFNKIFWY
ncbi:RNA-guided endonuclease IscB, partial [Bacillus sp. 03113]|uniref:RNA-guided endonuclease IscB n=1 Tax=Bacillus sp. 03113 TaxID=2578211 RepID=UPI0011428E03